MSFSKPKVTIDLDEYSELIKLKEYSNSAAEGISQKDLSKAITHLLNSVHSGNGLDPGIKRAYSELNVIIEVTQLDPYYKDFKFIKSIK